MKIADNVLSIRCRRDTCIQEKKRKESILKEDVAIRNSFTKGGALSGNSEQGRGKRTEGCERQLERRTEGSSQTGKEFGFPGGSVGEDTPASAGDTIDVVQPPGSGDPTGQEITHSSALAW